jgi:hypothetical protein
LIHSHYYENEAVLRRVATFMCQVLDGSFEPSRNERGEASAVRPEIPAVLTEEFVRERLKKQRDAFDPWEALAGRPYE